VRRRKTLTAPERVGWAVSFVNDEPGGLSASEWRNRQEALMRFLSPHPAGLVGHHDPETDPPTVGALRNLQGAARHLLAQVATTDTNEAPRIRTSVEWQLRRSGAGTEVHAHGDLKDVFLTQLVVLLLQAGPSNLKRCPAPSCARLFWRVRRQKYCSLPCTRRAVFQAWLKTPKGRTRPKREAKAARERRAYKRMLAARRSRRVTR
jgi:hypothetical protein